MSNGYRFLNSFGIFLDVANPTINRPNREGDSLVLIAGRLVYRKPFVNTKSVGLRSPHRVLDVVRRLERNEKSYIIP